MRQATASILVAPLAIVLLMGSALVGVDRLGFRDVSHFYTPLYDYVAERQSERWSSLWNPLDQTGIPLAGETTTAVFYPLRWIVYQLVADADVAMSWYIALHLILASVNAWIAARWARVSPMGAAVAAIAYALSGSVFFLYTNPPFLVGASWMPLVLAWLIVPGAPRTSMRMWVASIALAMMILGGDPQTAFHAMVMGATVWITRRIRGLESASSIGPLLFVPTVAACLAAPQIAASLDWSRRSDRVLEKETGRSWFAPPVVGSKRYQAFQFSLPPWHAAELLTPEASGRLYPINERISRLLPGDGRMWTPSIYMGMLVAIALLVRVSRCRADGIDAWFGSALLAILLAMGPFGFVWWLQATLGALPDWDSAVGGPYWILYHALPGYESFRYPAKWLTFFALGGAITTARLIDQPDGRAQVSKYSRVLLFLVVIGTIAMWLGSSIEALFNDGVDEAMAKDEFWGPLRVEGYLAQMTRSLIHSSVVVAILSWCLWRESSARLSHTGLLASLVLLIAIDTSLSARSMLMRIPSATERALVDQYDAIDGLSDGRWMRTQSGGGWPRAWSETSRDRRAVEVEASGRASLFGRWHLPQGAAVLNNMVSIQSREMDLFWEAARSVGAGLSRRERVEFWAAMRNWLNVRGILHSSSRTREITIDQHRYQMVDRATRAEPEPRDLIRPHWKWTVREQTQPDLAGMSARLKAIAAGDGGPVVQVKTKSGLELVSPPFQSDAANCFVRAARQTAESATFDIELSSPALMTRCVYQDGNWSALVESEGAGAAMPTEVYQVDFLQQGVILPAGQHRLHFRYRPWWLFGSLILATIAWLGMLLGLASRFAALRRTIGLPTMTEPLRGDG